VFLFAIFAVIIFLFGFVVLFGAPYVPTLKDQQEAALHLLDLKPGQTLLELGSGDGRVLRRAAAEGINTIGYELNPILVVASYLHTFKYRKKVKIIWGNYWTKSWPEADGVYVFLQKKYMSRLNSKIVQELPEPVKIASYAFKIPKKKVFDEKYGIYLYIYK
jgi:hypothetical protein